LFVTPLFSNKVLKNCLEKVLMPFAYRNTLAFIPLVTILSNDFTLFSPESYESLFTSRNLT